MPTDDEDGDWLLRSLGEARSDLVVLAGWLKLVPPRVVEAYRGRMINIHPALLPAFGGPGMYGRRVHDAVVSSGARVSGATVHFVDEVYDHGAIIAQWPVPVHETDDGEALASRVLGLEHRLLPEVVRAYAEGRFRLGAEGRTVWADPWFRSDVFSMLGASG
jgi:folate-dependent phosphoribosylglycinamide formyltransferase PurN